MVGRHRSRSRFGKSSILIGTGAVLVAVTTGGIAVGLRGHETSGVAPQATEPRPPVEGSVAPSTAAIDQPPMAPGPVADPPPSTAVDPQSTTDGFAAAPGSASTTTPPPFPAPSVPEPPQTFSSTASPSAPDPSPSMNTPTPSTPAPSTLTPSTSPSSTPASDAPASSAPASGTSPSSTPAPKAPTTSTPTPTTSARTTSTPSSPSPTPSGPSANTSTASRTPVDHSCARGFHSGEPCSAGR